MYLSVLFFECMVKLFDKAIALRATWIVMEVNDRAGPDIYTEVISNSSALSVWICLTGKRSPCGNLWKKSLVLVLVSHLFSSIGIRSHG
jgi:hypothetical protein